MNSSINSLEKFTDVIANPQNEHKKKFMKMGRENLYT